jgi:hypothetical protein
MVPPHQEQLWAWWKWGVGGRGAGMQAGWPGQGSQRGGRCKGDRFDPKTPKTPNSMLRGGRGNNLGPTWGQGFYSLKPKL